MPYMTKDGVIQGRMINHLRRVLSFRRLAKSLWFRLRPVHVLLGRLIEINGNFISIGDTKILLGSGLIPTNRKIFVWSGYEYAERSLISKYMDISLPVIELGGFIGGVSCLTNKALVRPSYHWVVEANPHALTVLEQNRELNACRFEVLHRAIAYGCDRVTVVNAGMSSTIDDKASETSETVKTVTLREILYKNEIEMITLICDIEGHEYALLDNEAEIIQKHVAFLFVEIHKIDSIAMSVEKFLENLASIGFVVLDQIDDVYYLRNIQLARVERKE